MDPVLQQLVLGIGPGLLALGLMTRGRRLGTRVSNLEAGIYCAALVAILFVYYVGRGLMEIGSALEIASRAAASARAIAHEDEPAHVTRVVALRFIGLLPAIAFSTGAFVRAVALPPAPRPDATSS